jgi:hypothetical protein
MSLDTLSTLTIPVPPMLEQALGYFGSARLVAFYWEPVGDKALFDDGVVSADAEQLAYQGLLEHPTVAAQVRAYDLGNNEQEAQQWLLLDREARFLYALPAREAAALLYEQWATQPEASSESESEDESAAAFNAFIEEMGWQDVPVGKAAVERRRQEQEARRTAMLAWLDQQVVGKR